MAYCSFRSTDRRISQPRDENNIPYEPEDGGPRARYIVQSIVRIKKLSGQEYLYTIGTLKGYNALGEPVIRGIRMPECLTKTIFDTERRFDNKTRQMYQTVKGIRESITIYEMECSPENIDKLYEKIDFTSPYPVNLLVKSGRSGTVVDVRSSTLEESLRLFKDKSFEFLLESSYLTPYQKQEIKTRAKAITGGLIEPNGPTGQQQQQSTTYYVPKAESSNDYTVTSNYTEDNIIDGTITDADGVQTYHSKNMGYLG